MPPARFSTLVKPAFLRISAAFWLRAPERQWMMISSVLVRGEFADALLEFADGDQRGAEVGDGDFVRLADVEDEEVFLGVELLLELPRR